MLDKTKIDLSAPAFGAGSQTLDSFSETSVEEKPEIKEEEVMEEETETSVEENKVPYSRFKKFHDRAIEAEAEADKWRQRAEEIEHSRTSRHDAEDEGDMPSYWKELYGDSEASQKAWQVQVRREEEIERRAYEAGQRGAQELENTQRERIESNVATIDEHFEDLTDVIGRELTEKEQSAVLDIVDDYTAKDEDGNYLGAVMPFGKAWEIYELKQSKVKQSQRKDRDSVASLSASPSQGDTNVKEEQDRNWNPLSRGTWRSRL